MSAEKESHLISIKEETKNIIWIICTDKSFTIRPQRWVKKKKVSILFWCWKQHFISKLPHSLNPLLQLSMTRGVNSSCWISAALEWNSWWNHLRHHYRTNYTEKRGGEGGIGRGKQKRCARCWVSVCLYNSGSEGSAIGHNVAPYLSKKHSDMQRNCTCWSHL